VFGVTSTIHPEPLFFALLSKQCQADGRLKIQHDYTLLMEREAYLLHVGDLVVTKSSGSPDHIGKTSLVTEDVAAMGCAFSNFMQRLRLGENTNPKLIWYYLNSLIGREQLVFQSTTTTGLGNLNGKILGNCVFALPPLPEQTAIVRFLDYMDRRIRRYTRAKQKMIKLLEEYKQALIHQAVTGQIDVRTGKPYPAYKDSGVEWLGEVPEHWEVKAVKRHYAIQLGKMLQTRPNNTDDVEVPYLKAQHIQWFSVRTSDAPRMWASPRDIQQFGITAGDLLVCEGGEGGRCGIVKEIPEGFIIQNALHRVRPHNYCRNDYLQYVMCVIAITGWFDALNNKATIAHFTREKFGALYIPIPSPDEQTAIVEYLDAQTAKIDAAIAALRREINLLREYRERLIADVVTGKVDVREVSARLPDVGAHGGAPLHNDTPTRAHGGAPLHNDTPTRAHGGAPLHNDTPTRAHGGAPLHENNEDYNETNNEDAEYDETEESDDRS
jgi:type I restriction enzyme S subunit